MLIINCRIDVTLTAQELYGISETQRIPSYTRTKTCNAKLLSFNDNYIVSQKPHRSTTTFAKPEIIPITSFIMS